MARDTVNDTPIDSKDQLVAHIAAGCKPQDKWRIGTEHEKFGFYTKDNSPVPYEGENGIKAILEGMEKLLGWEPISDDGKLIGLYDENGGGAISLEPGGQFELSGAPVENLHQTCREANEHLRQVRTVSEPLGIGFLGVGSSPKWSFDETPLMPKSRYNIMRAYMPEVGSMGLDMMFRTATIQVNLDFASEADMVDKLRLAFALQPLSTALFANSPFLDGKPTGFLSYRSEVWRDTDNNRSGMLPFVFDEGFGFEAYVDHALNVPMYFIKRGETYHNVAGKDFKQFLNGTLEGFEGETPTLGDWDNHLSTLFPEARLKRFIEMRGADGGPWRRICGLPAFWVGLLYDEEARNQALDLIRDWTPQEMQDLRDAVPVSALNADWRGAPLIQLAKRILDISELGLKNRAILSKEGYDETQYLAPAREVVASGQTKAEEMLNRYHGVWQESVEPIFDDYSF